ncbi:MAG TPA: hypothetical protein VF405_10055 [Gammaproteobacteria bacterium]
MGKINVARVILGGLLAGLIMNIGETVLNLFVIADESTAFLQRLGLQFPGNHQIAIFVAMTFVSGIIVIFLYAAMRPRFGAGAKTAVIAGLIVWLVTMMAGFADVVLGITPTNLLVVAGAWSLVETLVAAVAGAWLYQESA